MGQPPGHKCIFFNGPRGSGKDYTARMFANEVGSCRTYKMTTPMDKAIKAFFDVPDKHWKPLREEMKTATSGYFFEKTMVDCLISMSETWAKPVFGNQVFGRMAVNYFASNTTGNKFTLITDCGFAEEMLPIIGYFGITNCLVVSLYREGTGFELDSKRFGDKRRRVNGNELGIKHLDVSNGPLPNVPPTLVSTVYAITAIGDILNEFDMLIPAHMRAAEYRYVHK